MQAQSPLSRYQQALDAGEYQADAVQRQAVKQLDQIYQALQQLPAPAAANAGKRRNLLSRWLGKSEETTAQRPVQGLYMWGGVGRGKTWLMDLFFHSLPGDRKLRLHFHRFMLRVHEELTELQGQENPLEIVADGFKAQTDVLCFDEFFVSDITDAMLLATLLQALFARGITLVATSNIIPDNLYRNGLQRARFLTGDRFDQRVLRRDERGCGHRLPVTYPDAGPSVSDSAQSANAGHDGSHFPQAGGPRRGRSSGAANQSPANAYLACCGRGIGD